MNEHGRTESHDRHHRRSVSSLGRGPGALSLKSVHGVSLAAAVGLLTAAAGSQATAYRETIPGTTVTFEMVAVPGEAILIGRTEVTWDMYDVFALGLDKPAGTSATADAVARPSNPYGAPDYGWGHAGFPAISVTRQAAEAFAKWLSQKTGRVYRLPTDAEWTTIASAAAVAAPQLRGEIDAIAWHRGNAESRAHAVATKRVDRLGLYDLFGNAAEWVTTTDGALVVRGGSFKDDPATLGPSTRAVQDASWNERDPQLPKSRWWLSDGPFVGFRLVTPRTP